MNEKDNVSVDVIAEFDKRLDRLRNESLSGNEFELRKLLVDVVNAGSIFKDRLDRARLQSIADQLASGVFQIDLKYPPATIKGFGYDNKKPSLEHLHAVPTEDFVDRDDAIRWLDVAWDDTNRNVVTIAGWGGSGKTALILEWLERMSKDNFRGAQGVFAWTFSHEHETSKEVSGKDFVKTALTYFGDPDPTGGSERDRGARLAELALNGRNLLVIDGLERVQEPPLDNENVGALKPLALQGFVDGLLRANVGPHLSLCVITSRLQVKELAKFTDRSVLFTPGKLPTNPEDQKIVYNLLPLDKEPGVSLLRDHLHVDGNLEELTKLVEEVDGHAYSLKLLGSLIKNEYGGKLAEYRKRPALFIGNLPGANNTLRSLENNVHQLLRGYEEWFSSGPEMNLLHIASLYEGPVDAEQIFLFKKKGLINGLTEKINNQTIDELQSILTKLQNLGLLLKKVRKEEPSKNEYVVHPLVREMLSQRMDQNSWKEGHKRIALRLENSVEDIPMTEQDISVLYRAMVHHCRAGNWDHAWEKLLWKRIRHEHEHYPGHILGNWDDDLQNINVFFEKKWSEPVKGLATKTRAILLNEVGYDLRALGRLNEAIEPLQASLMQAKKNKLTEVAAVTAGNLSKVLKPLGELIEAEKYAREAVVYGQESKMELWMMATKVWLGDVLHQLGKWEESLSEFHQAQKIQECLHKKNPKSESPLLWNTNGFRYRDLVLDLVERSLRVPNSETKELIQKIFRNGSTDNMQDSGEDFKQNALKVCQRIREETLKTLSWVQQETRRGKQKSLFLGVDLVILGRAKRLELQLSGAPCLDEASEYTWRSRHALKHAGDNLYYPRGLLYRAAFIREQANNLEEEDQKMMLKKANEYVGEAFQIANTHKMKLYQADCNLEYTRLSIACEKYQEARNFLNEAKESIKDMGYKRRDWEVEELEKKLKASGY